MSLLTRITSGFRALSRQTRTERELDAELRAFLEIASEEKMRAGLNPAHARRAARLELGSMEAVKDHVRDVGWESIADSFRKDVQYALRLLRKSPGFTSMAVVSLALGIGANTAVFQLVDAVRLRPLPVTHPEQLIEVRMADPSRGRMGTFSGRRPLFTYALWEELQQRQQAFSGVVAWGAYPVNLSIRDAAQYGQGLWVSGDFFNVLGLVPHIGRLLWPTDDVPGCGSPAAVLGYAFWQRHYAGDPSVLGKTVTLDGHSFEIVGVAPQGFAGLEVGRTFDVATPLCAERILNLEHSALDNRSWWWLTVIGRLAPGWSVERASSHLASVSASIFQNTVPAGLPPDVTRAYLASTLEAFPAVTGVSGTVREEYETPLWVLLAVAVVVLMIAAANIATLMLARAIAREREIAVRLALGASRKRIAIQFVTESVIVAAAAAAVAVLLAQTLSESLVGLLRTSSFQFFAVTFELALNWRVLLFAATVTVGTCILFGVAPAVFATRQAARGLIPGAARTATEGRAGIAARNGLVVAQVALSLALVITALLFVRTLRNLISADTGFDPQHVATVVVDYQRANVPPERRLALQGQLLEALRALPGVRAAASVQMVPLTGESSTGGVVINGALHEKETYFNRVSPAFFLTMGATIRAGRDFTPADSANSQRVAIVNESFARELLRTGTPIGSTFQLPAPPGEARPTFEIVGVVNDTKYTSLRAPFEPIAFFPSSQDAHPIEYVNVVVRTTSPTVVASKSVAEAATRVVPEAVVLVVPFQGLISDSVVRERLMAMLSGFFAGVAALLAMLGLYGVVSYTVTQRTREIGIRAALGAQRSEILFLVLRQSTRLALLGVAPGLVVGAVTAQNLRALLFGLEPLDPSTFVAVGIAFPTLATLAAWIPARRATEVEPVIALRCE